MVHRGSRGAAEAGPQGSRRLQALAVRSPHLLRRGHQGQVSLIPCNLRRSGLYGRSAFLRSDDAQIHPHPRQPDHPDLHRDHVAGLFPDPPRAGRSHRDACRRARHRSRAPRAAAQGIRLRQAGPRPVRDLSVPRPAGRSRQVDDHAGAGAERVLVAVPGDHRAGALRHHLCARPRASSRNPSRRSDEIRSSTMA